MHPSCRWAASSSVASYPGRKALVFTPRDRIFLPRAEASRMVPASEPCRAVGVAQMACHLRGARKGARRGHRGKAERSQRLPDGASKGISPATATATATESLAHRHRRESSRLEHDHRCSKDARPHPPGVASKLSLCSLGGRCSKDARSHPSDGASKLSLCSRGGASRRRSRTRLAAPASCLCALAAASAAVGLFEGDGGFAAEFLDQCGSAHAKQERSLFLVSACLLQGQPDVGLFCFAQESW
jgi:hypothetical protein